MTSGPRGRDRGGRATRSAIPEVHCGASALRQARDWYRHAAVCRRAVAELAEEVPAPAIGRPGAREPAGVTAACGEGGGAQASGNGDRRCAVRRLTRTKPAE